MNQPEFVWTIISFIFTLMILSYIIGDNFLFRIASYIFVGVSSAYVSILLLQTIIIPKLILPLLSGDINKLIFAIIPLVLSLLLLFKLSPRYNHLGSLPMSILVGAGIGVLLTGSILGTLLPQSQAAINFSEQGNNWFTGIIILFGTVSTLLYFQFTTKGETEIETKPNKVLSTIKKIGAAFIGISLGSIFAGILLSSLIALISRLNFLIQFITSFFGG